MALAEASCTRHILPKQAAQGTYGVLTLLSPLSQYAFSLPDQHSRPPACLGRAACLGPEAQARQHCRVGGIGGLSLSLPEGSFSLSLSLSLIPLNRNPLLASAELPICDLAAKTRQLASAGARGVGISGLSLGRPIGIRFREASTKVHHPGGSGLPTLTGSCILVGRPVPQIPSDIDLSAAMGTTADRAPTPGS